MEKTIAVGIVLYKERSVLLVKHTEKAKLPTGIYNFPAGRVEEGETLEAAAVRELEEETGLRTKVRYLYKLPAKESKLKMKEKSENFLFYTFLCTHYSGELKPSDKTIPEFVNLDSLDKFFLLDKDIIEISRKYYNIYYHK